MSHELRTPMNGILGMASLLLKSNPSRKQAHFAERIKQSGESLLGLLNNLLDVSKIEAGHVELEMAEFHLPRVLQEVDALMGSRAMEKGLGYESRVATAIPGSLKGDYARIKQVLFNLIGNAIKFTETGGVTIDVTHCELAGGRCLLRFEVRDTGIGIDSEKKELVFEKFVQADASTTRVYGGTGLGLTICQDLVGLMGGEIGVESEPGKGSSFWFTIPCEVPVSQGTEVAPGLGSAELPRHAPASQPLRILLAEDNLINQEIAVVALEDSGHRVDVVDNGADAVQAVRDGSYDAVLMDVYMPVMDGIAAVEKIRALPGEVSEVPVIAVTANAMTGDRDKYIAIGMNDYVSKPFDPHSLLATIRRCVKDGSAAAAKAVPRSAERAAGALKSGLDQAVVEPLRVSKPALWKRLVDLYLTSTPEDLESLERALAEDDKRGVEMAAHKTKSSSANIGATAISELCRRIEAAARDGDLESGRTLVAELRSEFQTVTATLAEETGEQGAAA